jgi:hypothetical protein
MKIVFISPITPYKENMGGPSGHPYHLMIQRPSDIEITIYSYNQNNLSKEVIKEVENELKVKIKLVRLPLWYKLILQLHLTFVRMILKYPINYYIRLPKTLVEEIHNSQPYIIWGYCQEFSGILSQFKEFKRIHTTPDCYCLHWYRRLGRPFTLSHYAEYLRVIINYIKYYRMESQYDSNTNIKYHFVGDADAEFVRRINPAIDAYFLHHPHYEIRDPKREIRFHQPKIRLLIAGRYDLYSYEASNDFFSALQRLDNTDKDFFKEHYELTILGKGWSTKIDELKRFGYEINLIDFAPDYIEEIIKYDIQINPLSVGTGTKGKVLDALANGLLVIGTPYAMENIAVENNKSCVIYRNTTQLMSVLKEIPCQRARYEAIAIEGRKCILDIHNRGKISKKLFDLFS